MEAAQQDTQDTPAEFRAVIRDGVDADWPLLYAAFTQVYSGRGSFHAYKVHYRILVSKLECFRNHPDWRLVVACSQQAPDEIMGMLLYRRSRIRGRQGVAWLTVKPIYQGKGFARALIKYADIQPGQIDCAFVMPEVAKWCEPRGYTLRFRPYLPDQALFETLRAEIDKHGA